MSDASKQRTMKYGINAGLLVLIVAGILVAVNVIGAQFFHRIDLTEGKEFTISDATKRVLRGLDDVVNVKVFFSEQLPAQLTTLEQDVADTLKEYEIYSDGMVRVRFIDPKDDPELRRQAEAMGIPQLQMNVMERDQYQVTNVFLGIGIQYGDQTEAIPVVQDLNTFEYDITSAIVKLTQDREPVLGILAGHGSRDLNTEMTGINQLLGATYQIQTVNLNEGRNPIPEDIDALFVAGPKNLPDRIKYEIDQYVMRGGKLLCFVDPITINEAAGLQATPASSGMNDMLAWYGVEMRDALVLASPSACAMASFSQGYMRYVTPYPFWPKASPAIYPEALSMTHPITSRLESVTFPWTAPLALMATEDEDDARRNETLEDVGGAGAEEDAGDADPGDTIQPGVRGRVLARTTPFATTQTGRYDLSPNNPAFQTQPTAESGQSYPLAIVLNGRFQSFYSDKPIPAKPGQAGEGDEDAPALDSTADPVLESPETQVLIAGTSHLLTDQTLSLFPENVLFLQNAVDWMTIGDELIAIRSRGATERPIREISDTQKSLVKYLNIFGVAALVIVFGLIWNVARKKSRERLAESYAR